MNRLLSILKKELDSPVAQSAAAFPRRVPLCIIARERFAEAARLMKRAGALLAAEWAADESRSRRGYGIYACYRSDADYLIIKCETPLKEPSFPSITKRYAAAYRMERQMHSLMGVILEGNPDLRPWIKFEDWPADAYPLRKKFRPEQRLERVKGEYHFGRVEGEGVYEIPVGPVHAGIIEPGHFRFHAMGEDIINLEERLGYVHKGIEKRFEQMAWLEAYRLAGRVSGDSTVAHSLAYCYALEAMTRSAPPERSQWIRAVMLERERIANHLGDIGAICNDVAFAFMLYQTMRLKELMLRTNKEIFGHRFMMDAVEPGGVRHDLDRADAELILSELAYISSEFERLVIVYDENSSLDDRLRTTGEMTPEEARDLGLTGLVARASGMLLDARVQQPVTPYDIVKVNPVVLHSGDVHARAWVRVEEIRESIRLIRELLSTIPDGKIKRRLSGVKAEATGFGICEGWRGDIIYWLQAGPEAEINRCMVRDPSVLSWIGLERAVQGNIVPDFPLCNKSFNQSYSGHDL